jgi:hypothetical protein
LFETEEELMSQKKGIFRALKRMNDRRRRENQYSKEILRGAYPLPPQSVKLAVVRNNIPTPRPSVFVETGTYHGDTVAAVKDMYARVISIEVDETLYKKACTRFANDKNIRIVHGDCAREMPAILATLQQPAVFWLDGHYSGEDTGKGEVEDPILISLKQIAASTVREHVIFIDDARTFDGRDGRPDISDVFNYIKKIDSRYIIRVQSDIIIATVAPLPIITR